MAGTLVRQSRKKSVYSCRRWIVQCAVTNRAAVTSPIRRDWRNSRLVIGWLQEKRMLQQQAGYEVLYQEFNVSHTAPEARSAQSRTIGLRHHLQPRLEHYRYAVQVL
jgi:hypothetical protein